MAYNSASDVSALCQNLLAPEEMFTLSTCPTLTEVESWMSTGCAIIEAHLSSWGYEVPISASIVVYDWLRQLNTYYGVAMAEASRTNVITAPGERTRAQTFEKMFWDGLDRIKTLELTIMGVVKSTGGPGTLYAGGISESDKDAIEADTDRVQPRFRRNQFGFSGTLRPDRNTTDEDEDD